MILWGVGFLTITIKKKKLKYENGLQTNFAIFLECNFWSLHSLILVVLYTYHIFKFINAHLPTNGKFREPTDLSYYITAKHKESEIWKESPSIYIFTQLSVLHVSVQAVTRKQPLTEHLDSFVSCLNQTTKAEEIFRKMNSWGQKN